MPCYLFTYHGYGTWMPDKKRGYVKRGQGVVTPDSHMAVLYRANQKQACVQFDDRIRTLVIAEAIRACTAQGYRLHYVASEATHFHVLVSWKSDRPWKTVRAKLRESFTRKLNKVIQRREWLAKSSSRKHVECQQHFDYLVKVYLPKHRGWKWAEGIGMFQ